MTLVKERFWNMRGLGRRKMDSLGDDNLYG